MGAIPVVWLLRIPVFNTPHCAGHTLDIINTLIYESSLAKYEVMTGERGPTTYLIFHDDFDALQNMANTHEAILGVEQHEGSNVAKMAFVSGKSPLIEELRQLAVVSSMINRNVAMLCH